MALITVCKACRARVNGAHDACPRCQSASLRFQIDYRPQGRRGKHVRQDLPESIATAHAAQQIEAVFQRTRKKKKADAPTKPASQLINKLFPLYLDNHSEIYHSASTHADISSCYHAHYEPILGRMDVADTDGMEIYIKVRLAEKASHRTINKELDYFAGFRKWLARKHAIAAPAERPAKLKHSRPLPQVLGIDEVVRIIEAAEPFYRAFFLALFVSGLRMNEARQLKWHDVDMKNRIARVKQKGGSYKILPVSDLLVAALKEIRPRKYPPDRYIFLNEKSGKPIGQVRKALARACAAAKIDRHVYPHLFRHSVATFLMGENLNMRKLQHYMGHSKIGTTEFYTHVNAENLREAEQAVTAAMQKAMNKQSKNARNDNKLKTVYTKR